MDLNALPLFPLSLVLFPGTAIPLHIFEDRYQKMVADVLEGDGLFGLVYHDPDLSGPFMNEPGPVGTVAEIRRHQSLRDGRSLILVRGRGRFRILEEVVGGAPYFQADVEKYRDSPVDRPKALEARRLRSLDLFRNVIAAQPHVPKALPSFDAEREISFKLAASARMDPVMQQELLEMQREELRLDRLDPVFRFGIGQAQGEGQAEA